MGITKDIVRHTAELARLDLTALPAEEVDALRHQLDEILEYAAQLDELDLTGIEPTTHAVPIDIPLREDVPQPGPGREAVLANAPEQKDGFFVVPRVIGK